MTENISIPIVQVKQGTLRGFIQENIDGGEYISFLGIPYAEPPLGNFRFRVTNYHEFN